MLNAEDLDGVFVDSAEHGAVIAAAEAKVGPGRLELDDVAGAGFQITVDDLKNLPAVSRSMARS